MCIALHIICMLRTTVAGGESFLKVKTHYNLFEFQTQERKAFYLDILCLKIDIHRSKFYLPVFIIINKYTIL